MQNQLWPYKTNPHHLHLHEIHMSLHHYPPHHPQEIQIQIQLVIRVHGDATTVSSGTINDVQFVTFVKRPGPNQTPK